MIVSFEKVLMSSSNSVGMAFGIKVTLTLGSILPRDIFPVRVRSATDLQVFSLNPLDVYSGGF